MRLRALSAFLLGCAVLPAQTNTTSVSDVGLTLVSSLATTPGNAVAGQACGAFTCTPFRAGSPASTTNARVHTVRVHGDASSLYVLALGTGPLAQPCLQVPGIGNALILGQPIALLSIGVIGPNQPSTSVACRQGVASYQLVLPNVAPAVVPFGLQAVTYSAATQAPAFTVAIQAWAR